MSELDAKQHMDHVVVVMFENRSFDNLLGYLYEPGEVASFEGVAGRTLSNPIPDYAPDAHRGVVPVHPAENMDTPNPDPGGKNINTSTPSCSRRCLHRTIASN
jgi:phospholipase C